MRKLLPKFLGVFILALCASAEASADVTVKQKTTSGGQTYEGVTMIKGKRQRSETRFGGGAGQINITQCDLRRNLIINEAGRRFYASPLDASDQTNAAASDAAAATPAEPARRGGTVTYTTTVTDTGERRQILGLTARHIKTSLVKKATPDACDQEPLRYESDGWYVDLEADFNCNLGSGAGAASQPITPGGCRDKIVTKQVGTARLGVAVLLTSTSYGPDGSVVFTSSQEAVEISRAPLDAALFDAPAGYAEVKSFQELYAIPTTDASAAGTDNPTPTGTGGTGVGATPQPTQPTATQPSKKPGTIRIGVVEINNRTDRPVDTSALQARLIGSLNASAVEAVPLRTGSPAGIEAEAKQRECDFILTTEVTALKQQSAARKLGGVFGRATGVGSGGVDKTEARVEFRLVPTSGGPARLASSASAKEDGDDSSAGAALDKAAQAVLAEARKQK